MAEITHPRTEQLRAVALRPGAPGPARPQQWRARLLVGADVSGDAVVRFAIYNHAVPARLGLFLEGAALLFGYCTLVNLTPLEFGQVVGLYIATLFVVWQVIDFVAFWTPPTLPTVIGWLAGGARPYAGSPTVANLEASHQCLFVASVSFAANPGETPSHSSVLRNS